MFRDLTPYASVSPTGTAWLGNAPKHWQVVPGAGVLRLVRARNKSLREDVVLSLSYGRVVVKPEETFRGLIPASFETYQVLDPGSIVVRPTDLQNDHTSVRVGLVRNHGIITSAYLGFHVARPAIPEFAYLYLAVLDAKKVFYGMGSGLRQNLEWADFKRLPVLLPPPSEQAAIVKYLGHAHARIDRAIAAKRGLIALLEEQKQAIVNQAVTRGLDCTAPMKETRRPWLGEIRADWDVTRLGWQIQLVTGFPFASSGFTQRMDDARLLRGVNVGVGTLRWDDVVRWPTDAAADLQRYAVDSGDIVLAMDRPIISAGVRVARIRADEASSILVQRVARIRTRSELDGEYLLRLLSGSAFANYLRPIFTGISVPHLSPQQIRDFTIPLPPLSAQKAIVAFLEEAVSGAEAAQAAAGREVRLLREFRTRLTSDVVTGQLDVREVAARLPDLIERAQVDAAEDVSFDEPEEVDA